MHLAIDRRPAVVFLLVCLLCFPGIVLSAQLVLLSPSYFDTFLSLHAAIKKDQPKFYVTCIKATSLGRLRRQGSDENIHLRCGLYNIISA